MITLTKFTPRLTKFIKESAFAARAEFEPDAVQIIGVQVDAIDGGIGFAVHTGDTKERTPVIPEYTNFDFRSLEMIEWNEEYWSDSEKGARVKNPQGEVISGEEGDEIYGREFVRWAAGILDQCALADDWPFPNALLAAEAISTDPTVVWKRGALPQNIE